MTVKKEEKDGKNIWYIEGEIDSISAPMLSEEIDGKLEGINDLVFDMKEVPYLSSAGVRVVTKVHKEMSEKNGKFAIINCTDVVKGVFDAVGLLDVININ